MGRLLLEKLKDNRWFAVSVILMAIFVLYFGTGFTMQTTDNPEFCGSCHVMHEPVRPQSQSVHADLSCNECHAPKPFPDKATFKTYAGSKDIYKNFLTEVGDIIHASDLTREVVGENCSDCHRHVPRSPKLPIDESRVAGE